MWNLLADLLLKCLRRRVKVKPSPREMSLQSREHFHDGLWRVFTMAVSFLLWHCLLAVRSPASSSLSKYHCGLQIPRWVGPSCPNNRLSFWAHLWRLRTVRHSYGAFLKCRLWETMHLWGRGFLAGTFFILACQGLAGWVTFRASPRDHSQMYFIAHVTTKLRTAWRKCTKGMSSLSTL